MYLFYYLNVMSILLPQLIGYFTCSLHISKKDICNEQVRKVLNNEHFLIIHGKIILKQHQSLIILSQSMGVNKKVILIICLF